jgi:NAD(P)-dependent dehydrogenase (short-subunit alcohol dehydrogenase family)
MEGLDILVNNAGVTRDNLFLRMKDEEWDTVIAVNLTASFRLSRAAVKGMMRRRFGRIVNIGSVVGSTGNPGQGNYAASKAGLIGMTKALAAEVASRNITVNCVAPGLHRVAHDRRLNDKQREGILGTVPMGRLGKGERSPRPASISPRRGRLRDRPHPARERRHGDVLSPDAGEPPGASGCGVERTGASPGRASAVC